MNTASAMNNLMQVPGVGKSIAKNLIDIDIMSVNDLKGKNPEKLYDESNSFVGMVQDRCLLYVFRCAVYYADTEETIREQGKLKWWNWKDNKNA